MKRFFVTGGAGFIGSHVVDSLVARGDEVVVVDSFHPSAHREKPSYLNAGATYLPLDVRDEGSWDAAADADAVLHLAGKVGLGVDFADTTEYASHNDLGMAVGLTRLAEMGSVAPFILASSMVVYGEGRYRCPQHGLVQPNVRSNAAMEEGRFDPECPRCGSTLTPEAVPEDAALEPRNVYAATKLHQEHLLNAYCSVRGIRGVALRFHNVYGSRMPANTPYSGVAAIFASAAAEGRAPQVYEDGQQIRDFVHVQDVARAVIAAADSPEFSGAVNVGSGAPRPIIDMATAIVVAANSQAPPEVVGKWRAGDVRHVFADSTRLWTDLLDGEAISLEAGVQDVVGGSLRAAPERDS